MGVSSGASPVAVDCRAGAARAYLVVTVALGLTATGLILVQAGLLARVLAAAARGDVAATLSGTRCERPRP
jgi:hypothetical protein